MSMKLIFVHERIGALAGAESNILRSWPYRNPFAGATTNLPFVAKGVG
jgi:hypothetical protein